MTVPTAKQQIQWIRVGLAMGSLMLSTAACVSARSPAAQPMNPHETGALAASAPPPGACEVPASERTDEIGCYLTAVEPLGTLPEAPMFWHLYQYSSHADAEAAKGPRGTVVESFGRVLLHTIAEEGWRPAGGERLAVIGPLPHETGKPYTARYIEGAFRSGMLTTAHRHSGAEAWYLFEGAQCLETPEGSTVVRAGETAVVRAGPPMVLSHVGEEVRRSVALVLHESSEPWITRVSDWQPRGLCPR